MASATPAIPSTKETTNYARLCRVLVDVGTCALRDCFDLICTPPTLHTVLAANQPTLQSLRSKRIINPTQWGKLFPAIPASVSSRDFDITLLMILLRNICGLAPPLTGWDALPGSLAVFVLFGSVVKKRLGSCVQSIRFWIWSKEAISVVDHLDQWSVFRFQ